MKPSDTRQLVLKMYRMFRRQGRTPMIAMQMVRNACIGISDPQPILSGVDIELPPALRSEAAMMSYVAGRYLKAIESRRCDRPFWGLGFMPTVSPSFWEDLPPGTLIDPPEIPLADWERHLLYPDDPDGSSTSAP